MGAMAPAAPLPAAVVEVGPTVSEFDEFDEFEVEFDVFDVFEAEGLDGEELHAARPSAAVARYECQSTRAKVRGVTRGARVALDRGRTVAGRQVK